MSFLSIRQGLLLGLGSLSLVLGLVHCSSGGDSAGTAAPAANVTTTPPAGTATGVVGVKGGAVSTADGRVTVEIPPGALGADTTITIEPATGAPAGSVGALFEIGPTGTQFGVAVKMTFKYAGADLAGHPVADLRAGTVSNGKWQSLATPSTDAVANTVTGTTMHLSPFGIFFSTTGGICLPRPWDFTCAPDSDAGTTCPPTPTCASPAGPGGDRPCDAFAGSLMTACQDHAGGLSATCCFPIDAPTCISATGGCANVPDGTDCNAPSCDDFCSQSLPGAQGVTQQTCDTDGDTNTTTAVCCLPAGTPIPGPQTGGNDGGTTPPGDGGSDDGGTSDGSDAGGADAGADAAP